MPSPRPLFDPDDPPAAPEDRSLAIQAAPDRPLGKEERAFNRALARLEALSRALDEEKQRLDRLLIFHAAEIRPRIDQAVALRAGLVRALARFLDDRRLANSQRDLLKQILIEQLDDVLMHLEKPDPDLQVLFERLHDVSYAQAVEDELKLAREGMAAIFEEFGLDVGVPELRADMTAEDAAAAAAQLLDELHRPEESRDDETRKPRRGKTMRAAAERALRHEQLRKNSLSAVYRRLVKELHPDLERDPAERERKSRVMQDITAAYTRGDFRALLQLEIEWLVPAHGNAARLSKDKLRAHTAMLREQTTELEAELQALPLHPRYAPLIVEGPDGIQVIVDGPSEVEHLDAMIEQLDFGFQRISSAEALEEVRGAIRDYRDAQKGGSRKGRRRRR